MRKLLLLIIFQLCCFTAIAAVFTVTSNADSGPGTLRQALLDAASNGSATQDFIYFNIADLSEAGRTITILTSLPAFSSNLIIDGTTQPGANFGISSAKIAVLVLPGKLLPQIFSLLNVNHCEIYGFSLIGNADMQGYYNTSVIGIQIDNSSFINIGKPAGGNLIENCGYGVSASGTSKVMLQSNIIGLKSDGITSYKNYAGINYTNVTDLVIGGNLLTEGNVICNYGQSNIILNNGINARIAYNLIGTTYTGNSTPGSTFIGTNYSVYGVAVSAGLNLDINNNLFSGLGDAVLLVNLGSDYNISNNKFGVGLTTNTNLANRQAVYIASCNGKGYISNNVIANNETGVSVTGSNALKITGNSFSCNAKGAIIINNSMVSVPFIDITAKTANSIMGKAPANSTIELFYTDECNLCQGKTYIANVQADDNGNWSYSGLISGAVVGTATDINGATSPFSVPEIVLSNTPVIKNAFCGNDGSITGVSYRNVTTYKWIDINGNTVGNDKDLIGVPAGKYQVNIDNGTCYSVSQYYEVKDYSVNANASHPAIKNAACNLPTGAISNIALSSQDHFTTKWRNEAGTVVATTVNLALVPAGKYTLEVTSSSGVCTQTFGPFTVLNATGPNIDQTNAIITPTNCGQYTGSITNITATGTGILKYNWKNAQGASVATTKDLTGQPAGVYTLQVTDDTQCGPVYTSAITIPEVNGITMDETAAVQTPVTCAGAAATVTGIKIIGATTYQWFNNLGQVVGNAAELSTNNPGNYRLVVSNANGCNQTSKVYTITQLSNTDVYGGLSKVLKDATCDLNNGSIEVVFQNTPSVLPKSYRWVNHTTGAMVATTSTPILSNIDAGTYDIYVTNDTGCERFLINYSIARTPALTVSTNNVQVTDDACNAGTGSISGIGATGKSPLTFTWTDAAGKTVGTAYNLVNVKAGKYHIKITDGAGCEQGYDYTINNKSGVIPAPLVSDLQLCSGGDAILSVINPVMGNAYRLYSNNNDETPMDDQKTGRFNINAKTNRSYYVSQYTGTCESTRVEVKVTVGITAVNIANTFSPNGDGINDAWKINSIENYPNALVQIFTRAGQKVFESTGYAKPFDGNYNGKPLPIGAYYYIINLNAGCSLLSGSVTIIR